MKTRFAGILIVVALAILTSTLAWADADTPTRYFGPGPGYPDNPGSKYFYRYYPPDQWQKYGYGTGHMGVGYGPYIYGGQRPSPGARDAAIYGPSLIIPKFKMVGNSQVMISAPGVGVTGLTVNVLSFGGAVLQTGYVNASPFEIVANIPDGATVLQIRVDTVSGFRAMGYSLY